MWRTRLAPTAALVVSGLGLAIALPVGSGLGVAQAQDPVVQGCQPADYLDRSAPDADRDITWAFSIQTDPERCLQVRVGQSVKWNGTFGSHPLDALGGDTPNPMANHTDGLVTFTSPGTFGYECGFHPQMKGAVKVVAGPTASVPAGGWGATAVSLLAMTATAAWLFRRRRAPPPAAPPAVLKRTRAG